jgi:hypothetical protein
LSPAPRNARRDRKLAFLACKHLGIERLESDAATNAVLVAAYEEGRSAGRKAGRRDADDWRGFAVNLIGAGR